LFPQRTPVAGRKDRGTRRGRGNFDPGRVGDRRARHGHGVRGCIAWHPAVDTERFQVSVAVFVVTGPRHVSSPAPMADVAAAVCALTTAPGRRWHTTRTSRTTWWAHRC